jgi:hypothetical protein
MMNYDIDIRYRNDLNWAATLRRAVKREKQAVGNIGAGANLCGRRV